MENKDTVALSDKLIATYLAYRFLGTAFFEAPTVDLLEQLQFFAAQGAQFQMRFNRLQNGGRQAGALRVVLRNFVV